MTLRQKLAGAAAIVGLVAGGAIAQSFGAPQPTYPTSFAGITPEFVEGNDSTGGSAANTCAAMGYGEASFTVPANARGGKIDPPVAYTDGNMSFILDATGTYIAWSATNADVKAVLVKGGTNHHIYRYAGTNIKADSWLASPSVGRDNVAGVSHYAFCYEYIPPVNGAEGCTPGYWRNHVDRWVEYKTTDSFVGVFGAGPDATLQQVVSRPQTYGAPAMHFVAALLNSTGGVPNGDGEMVDYKYTTAQVIAMVQAAYAAGVGSTTFKKIFGQLSAANEAGCPLGGTPANRG